MLLRKLPLVTCAAAVLLCVLAFATTVHAQQRPLITEDVDIIPPGTLRIEAGIDFLQGAKYPVSGLTGKDLERDAATVVKQVAKKLQAL